MHKRVAIYPGTFDPITNGHVDVIERASKLFDEVILLVAVNAKKISLFDDEERFTMARSATQGIHNVMVDVHHGLIVEYAQKKGAVALIRGVRAVSDFEYEFQLALMNRKLDSEISTIFMMPHEKYTYLNSSIIRELARLHQDVSEFVPPAVAVMLKKKFDTQ